MDSQDHAPGRAGPASNSGTGVCDSRIYYLAQSGQIYGPVDITTIAGWIGEGRATARDWVFVPRASDWVPILELPDMAGCFYHAIEKPLNPPPGLPVDEFMKFYRSRLERSQEPDELKMLEKRQWIRMPLSTSMMFTPIRDFAPEDPVRYVGYTLDISEGGVGFEWTATLEAGAILDLEIDFFPDTVRATAQVVHCVLLEKDTYRIGVAFRTLPEAERTKIRRFIRSRLHSASTSAPGA